MSLFECKWCDVNSTSGVHTGQCPSRRLAVVEEKILHLKRLAEYNAIDAELLEVIEGLVEVVRDTSVGIHDGRTEADNEAF